MFSVKSKNWLWNKKKKDLIQIFNNWEISLIGLWQLEYSINRMISVIILINTDIWCACKCSYRLWSNYKVAGQTVVRSWKVKKKKQQQKQKQYVYVVIFQWINILCTLLIGVIRCSVKIKLQLEPLRAAKLLLQLYC